MKNCKLTALILIVIMLFQMLPALPASAAEVEYPEITQAMLKDEMTNAIAKGHPYMLATSDGIAKIKEYAFGKDENLTELYSIVKAKADKLAASDITRIDNALAANVSYLSTADTIMNNAMILCLAYLVEGNESYAVKAYSQAEYLCSLNTWGSLTMLDNVRLLFAVSICYDWLYDWLGTDRRAVLANAVRTLCLNRVSGVYHNPDADEYRWAFDQFLLDRGSNHGVQDSSCIFLSAMAFADTDIEFMTDLMKYSMDNLLAGITGLYPDGIWWEGPSYWRFVGPFAARFMQGMMTAFGHCYGLNEIDFLKKMADYPIYTTSDYAFFNVGDCHFNHSYEHDPSFYMIGALSKNLALQSYAVQKAKETSSVEPLTVLMYDPAKSYDAQLTLANDKLLGGSMYQVTMRSGRSGNQNTFAGMNVRASFNNNRHADAGTLAFDALGERWITNNSKENYYAGYAGTDERFTWYRTRAEANSCIVINPSTAPGQDFFTASDGVKINEFVTDSGGAYAIADLTGAYASQAKSYKRGVQLADNRKVFVVQDEIVLKEASQVYSFFNIYDSDIEILDDGKSAILSKNNKKVYVTIDCDKDFTLSKMAAEPLSVMPDESKPNTPNPDFEKLALHFESIESANIRVCFIPYLCDEELSAVTCKAFVPMSDWTAPAEMKTSPALEDIKIGGMSIEGFNPFNRCYEAPDAISAQEVTAVYDNAKYDVEVLNDRKTGAVNILVTDKADSSNMNSYSLNVPAIAYPETTYTNSSFDAVMMPQEFYRIANNDNLSAMYFKDSVPTGCTKAVLTLHAGVVGESMNTAMKICKLDSGTQLRYLSASTAPVFKSSTATATQSAIGAMVVSGENMQRLEYDITSLISADGGTLVFALLPVNTDEDYLAVASHRNSEYSLRPYIKYYR